MSEPDSSLRSASPLFRLVAPRLSAIAPMNTGRGPSFYCVHPIGGDVAHMAPLRDRIGDVALFGVQVPRERMNAAFASSIEAVARHHVDALVALQPEGPVSLGGYSVGAVIALEMAQQLAARGRPVPLLVAFDGAPCNSGAGRPAWHPLYLLRLALNVAPWTAEALGRGSSWRSLLQRLEIRAALSFGVGISGRARGALDPGAAGAIVRRRGWLPDQISFFHALYEATARYAPRPYAGRVVVYECATQPLLHLRQLGQVWRKIAPASVVVRVAGRHDRFFEAPGIDTVAVDLDARLRDHAAGRAAVVGPAEPFSTVPPRVSACVCLQEMSR